MTDSDSLSGDEPALGGQAPHDDVRLGGTMALLHTIGLLNHADPKVRRRAAFAVARMGNLSAFDALVEILQDRDSRHRVQAAKLLSMLKQPQALDVLLQYALDRNEDVQLRTTAVRALKDFSDPDLIPQLRRLIMPGADQIDGSPGMLVVAVAGTLLTLGDVTLIDNLVDSARANNYFARQSLHVLPSRMIVPTLLDRLTQLEEHGPVRFGQASWLITTLRHARDIQASETLVRWLHYALEQHEDESIKLLVMTLGELADPLAIDVLVDTIDTCPPGSSDYHRIIDALTKIRDPRAFSALDTLAHRPGEELLAINAFNRVRYLHDDVRPS
jgi:HEAT repeat protein